MLINVSEKPVFYKGNGKLFGTVKGFVLHQEKLTFLYCKSQGKYVYIPIEQVVLGQDAVMLSTDYDQTLLSTSTKPEVYTMDGKKIGILSSIEFDESFQVTALKTEHQWIKKEDIVYMDHIIITKPIEIKTSEELFLKKKKYSNQTDSNIKENNELNFINNDLSLSIKKEAINESANIQTNNEDLVDTTETISATDKTTKEEIDCTVDPRYKYLLGKKLLKDITIASQSFNKDVIIDDNLIQFALDNNAIVQVIMNSED